MERSTLECPERNSRDKALPYVTNDHQSVIKTGQGADRTKEVMAISLLSHTTEHFHHIP